jgi:hypothetical protein
MPARKKNAINDGAPGAPGQPGGAGAEVAEERVEVVAYAAAIDVAKGSGMVCTGCRAAARTASGSRREHLRKRHRRRASHCSQLTSQAVHPIGSRSARGTVHDGPGVGEHARALLASDQEAIVIEADMREPTAILHRVTEQGFIDLAQPMAVLMLAVLHFIPDTAQAAGIAAAFREQMAARQLPGYHPRHSRQHESGRSRASRADLRLQFGRIRHPA